VDEIALHGIELSVGREWLVEKACLEWWMGYAAGCGIKVTTPIGSTLATHPFRYGYDYHEEKEFVEGLMAADAGREDI
jgi:hypothetical protein